MAHRQRWYVMQVVFEVTIRTLGGKFWLRPDAACKAIIDGVFGKALQHYDGIQLHAYDAQSNHVHYLVSATVPAQLPLFLDFVHGNIARQINALRRRRGTFWSRRGAVIAVLDPKAQVARLRYLLAQGPAAGLVCSPTQWPGASSTRALLDDLRVPASYVSLDKQRRNAALSDPRPVDELAEDVSFDLTPLPAWAKLTADARRAKVAALIDEIETQHKGKTFLGARALRTQNPHRAPKKPSARRCRAATRARPLGTAATPPRTATSAPPTCAPPIVCATIPPPRGPRSTASIRQAAWPVQAGTSRHPRTSSCPGKSAPRTPTNSPSPPDGRRPIPLAPTRHHHLLPPITACSPGTSPRSGQAGGAFGPT